MQINALHSLTGVDRLHVLGSHWSASALQHKSNEQHRRFWRHFSTSGPKAYRLSQVSCLFHPHSHQAFSGQPRVGGYRVRHVLPNSKRSSCLRLCRSVHSSVPVHGANNQRARLGREDVSERGRSPSWSATTQIVSEVSGRAVLLTQNSEISQALAEPCG